MLAVNCILSNAQRADKTFVGDVAVTPETISLFQRSRLGFSRSTLLRKLPFPVWRRNHRRMKRAANESGPFHEVPCPRGIGLIRCRWYESGLWLNKETSIFHHRMLQTIS